MAQQIFTRSALNDIMADEALTPQQRAERVFSLYGRALEDGYVSKGAAAQAKEAAVAEARAEWEKGVEVPDPRESDAYRALAGEFDAYRAMQAARDSEDFKGVKPKFFETVYGLVERGEGARPVREQLAGIREKYEEYFAVPAPEGGRPAPTVVLPVGGNPAPTARLSLGEAMRRANAGERVDVGLIG